MAFEKISGRIGSRVVGIIELFIVVILFGGFIWWMLHNYWETLQTCRSCILIAILSGIYFIIAITMSTILILSTFSIIGLNVRKWIAVSWCLFNMASFIGVVVFICVSEWCQDFTWFLLMIGYLIKLAVFFCIVCTYVWGLSEKIMDKKMYAMPVSPVHGRRARRY